MFFPGHALSRQNKALKEGSKGSKASLFYQVRLFKFRMFCVDGTCSQYKDNTAYHHGGAGLVQMGAGPQKSVQQSRNLLVFSCTQ